MVILTQRLPADTTKLANHQLSLTADDRTRSRHRFQTDDGADVFIDLPRGTVLQDGDRLQDLSGDYCVQIVAKPEPVLTVTATTPLDLIRAAYHLGNRHVPLEVTITYLRFCPDPVLKAMLDQLGLQVIAETAPFQPEVGAYQSAHHPAPQHHDPHHHHPHEHSIHEHSLHEHSLHEHSGHSHSPAH